MAHHSPRPGRVEVRRTAGCNLAVRQSERRLDRPGTNHSRLAGPKGSRIGPSSIGRRHYYFPLVGRVPAITHGAATPLGQPPGIMAGALVTNGAALLVIQPARCERARARRPDEASTRTSPASQRHHDHCACCGVPAMPPGHPLSALTPSKLPRIPSRRGLASPPSRHRRLDRGAGDEGALGGTQGWRGSTPAAARQKEAQADRAGFVN